MDFYFYSHHLSTGCHSGFLSPQNKAGHILSDNVSKSGPDFMLYCICSKFSFQRTTDSQKVAEILEKSHVTFTQFLPMVTSYMNHSTEGNLETDTVTTHIAYSDFTSFPVCVSMCVLFYAILSYVWIHVATTGLRTLFKWNHTLCDLSTLSFFQLARFP